MHIVKLLLKNNRKFRIYDSNFVKLNLNSLNLNFMNLKIIYFY